MAKYLCNYHNKLNRILKQKSIIDCSKVADLWERGKDKCDCDENDAQVQEVDEKETFLGP